jgi:hypothetical protein
MARKATQPMTIPAISPPDNLFFEDGFLVGASVGASVGFDDGG